MEDFRKFEGHRLRTFVIQKSTGRTFQEVSRIQEEDFRKSKQHRKWNLGIEEDTTGGLPETRQIR